MVLWIVASLALLIAAGTLFYARGLAQKLAHVTEMYWQLKYDHGELRAKLDPAVPAQPAAQQTFVPLSSIKRDTNR